MLLTFTLKGVIWVPMQFIKLTPKYILVPTFVNRSGNDI